MRNWHWPSKNVDINTWFAVYEQLFEHTTDYKVVTVGGPTDYTVKDHPLFVDRCGKYNSQQIKLLCDSAACFVGIDSGPFQCAAASRTHIVALLTHLHPDRILPYRNNIKGHNCTAVQTDIDCRGCNDNQRRPVRQLDCVHGDFRCSKSFDATAIADAIIKTL
jgi:ADP-heptose:LPS heptosyltransferase